MHRPATCEVRHTSLIPHLTHPTYLTHLTYLTSAKGSYGGIVLRRRPTHS